MNRKFFVLTFFLLTISFLPLKSVLAVANLPLGTVEQLSMKVTPEKPGANTPTTIRVDSYSSDLNQAIITWLVNGKVATKGEGQNVFQFQTGPLGSKTTVTVIITKPEGGTLEKTFVFQPAEVNLIYEANTYTPPFYKGKALFGHQAKYKVVAFPEITNAKGAIIPAEKLIYKWQDNFKVLQSQSGYGKNVLELDGPLLSEEQRIDVEVTAPDSDVVAQNFVLVDPVEPQLLAYENNLLYGYLFNHAITDTFTLADKEVSIGAFPYFFSAGNTDGGDMRYDWKLNGEPVYERKDLSTINFRNENNISGQAKIDIQATNATKMLQFSGMSFILNFAKNPSL